jgi:hypothetical protein
MEYQRSDATPATSDRSTENPCKRISPVVIPNNHRHHVCPLRLGECDNVLTLWIPPSVANNSVVFDEYHEGF